MKVVDALPASPRLASPRWSCSYEDALGRTICEPRPGFRGALLITSTEYNTANQLVATRSYTIEQSEQSNNRILTTTYFCYNTLGQRTLTVSDMNLNSQIDWSDTDRIVSNDTRYVSLNGDWWRESSTWQTRQNGSPELTLMCRTRTRLTGLGNGLDSETRSFDSLGHTITTAYDAEGRVLAQRGATYPVDYTYDAYGNKVSMTTYRNEDDIPVGGVVPNAPQTGDTTVGGVVPNAPHTGDTDRWLFGDLSDSIDSYTYNARSELTSARRTKNGQSIPGFSEDFDYDPIGNRRSSATYNEKGEAQTSTYQANNLNQYTTRTTPGYATVRGEADRNATVTVNENPTFRLGSYYFGSDLFDNSNADGLANLEAYAVKEGVGVDINGLGGICDDFSAMSNEVWPPPPGGWAAYVESQRIERERQATENALPNFSFVVGVSGSRNFPIGGGWGISITTDISWEFGTCCDKDNKRKNFRKLIGKISAGPYVGFAPPFVLPELKPLEVPVGYIGACPEPGETYDGFLSFQFSAGGPYVGCSYSFKDRKWSCGAGFTFEKITDIKLVTEGGVSYEVATIY